MKAIILILLILFFACKNASIQIEHQYSNDSIPDLLLKSNNEKCKIDTIRGVYIPKNLKDSHIVLDTMLDDSMKMYIRNGNDNHFGLGLYIRNNWGLWAGSRLKCYFDHKRIVHPDDMSAMIIHTYYMKLNNTRINEDSIIKETNLANQERNK